MSIMLLVLSSCSSTSQDHLFHDDQLLLTKLGYNNVVEGEEAIDQVELVNSEFSNEFVFDELRIVKSMYFTTELDYQLDPYFKEDIVGQEIEVVVSILELYSPIYEDWYSQEMLIFKYKEELTGFMSPSMGLIHDYMDELYGPYKGEFVFQSSMFMSGNTVLKYYESEDTLYQVNIDLSDTSSIVIETLVGKANEDVGLWKSYTSTGDNYQPLETDIALDLINRAKISKVYFEAVVTRVDVETGEILCLSHEEPTLTSIRLFYDGVIYNQDGELISFSDLEEGDRIETYYFKRYPSYQPIDIMVTRIDLK